MEHYQVLIVGGGQAGLSASYCLKKQGISHLILDRGEIGDSWGKRRWDSFMMEMIQMVLWLRMKL